MLKANATANGRGKNYSRLFKGKKFPSKKMKMPRNLRKMRAKF